MKTKVIAILSTALAFAQNINAADVLPMKLWYNTPAAFFEESLPIGNGRIGALVYGDPNKNILYLNDITLWTGKPVVPQLDADAHKWIPSIREALFNEDYARADSLQLHVQGPNSQFYQPLATLQISEQGGDENYTNYYRELDIDSAICRDHYTRNGVLYTREYIASHPDKTIALRLSASSAGKINCNLTLGSQVPHRVKAANNQLTMTGHAIGDAQESIHFCAILRTNIKGGTVEAHDSTLTLRNVDEAVVWFVNETSFNGADKHPVREGAPYLETAADDAWHLVNCTYNEVRSRHVADYQQFFSRLKLHLEGATYDKSRTTEQQLRDYTDQGGGNPYLETLYMQYGRYLLITSSRTPNVPANLQGLWTPHRFSPWRGNYTVNINLEENYWPAEVANLSELAMPLFGFTQSLAKNGRNVARNYYGIQHGWCSSHNSDIWAMANPVGEKRESPEWSNWNMGGAWLTQNLWEHFLYTQDYNYLRETLYPLLKGASEFMVDWLIENPKKPQELITAPSTSPENEYKTDQGYHGTTCYGGTADLAIIRELFQNTISAAERLDCDEDFRNQLRDRLQRLHPYQVGHQGDLNEWYHDWDDWDIHHRHQSHLIGLYPGHHISPDKTPDLATAATRTLEQKGDQTTGWSTGWRINLWARLRQASQAYHIYQKLLTYVSPDNYKGPDRRRSGGTYPNLFDAHPPFQIDGNFGGTAGVCEMLMQSQEGLVELLPALPQAWPAGQISGLKARGGVTVDFTWRDGKATSVTLKAINKTQINLRANGRNITVKLKKDKAKTIKL